MRRTLPLELSECPPQFVFLLGEISFRQARRVSVFVEV